MYSSRDPLMQGRFSRRDLPHWDVADATYFVTCCLAGSAPALGRLRSEFRQPARNASSAAQAFARYDHLLDTRPSVRWLDDPRLAAVVRDALVFGHGAWYFLLAFVVMPSHFHCVFTPLEAATGRTMRDNVGDAPRARIMHSLKRHSARECNRIRGASGAFWQAESYDRVLRDPTEVERAVAYVERNPVKAGLCNRPEEWEFSSAFWRRSQAGAGL